MPYFDIHIPSAEKRLVELFRLRRWCWKCNDWSALLHIHRGAIRHLPSEPPPAGPRLEPGPRGNGDRPERTTARQR